MRWVLFDDPRTRVLRPLTWLRPASALRLGAETGTERLRRKVAPDSCVALVRGPLVALGPARHSWEEFPALAERGDLWVSDLLLPEADGIEHLRRLEEDGCWLDGELLLAARLGPAQVAAIRELTPNAAETAAPLDGGFAARGLARLAEAARHRAAAPVPVARLADLSDLVVQGERLLREDADRLAAGARGRSHLGDGFAYAPERIVVGEGVRVDHGAVLDAREGPIVLEAGVEVHPRTWLIGPIHAGPRCRFLGGKIGGSSFGPECRVHGEIEATTCLGYVNKAHDGFVGHSYLAEWINLGALTTTSDLKNNYSTVSLESYGSTRATGAKKVGSFLGDHVKTRIGCLLNTGTVVGLGASVFGEPAVAAKFVPDFAWGTGVDASEYDLEKFLETAEIVMGRRGVALTAPMRGALELAHRARR